MKSFNHLCILVSCLILSSCSVMAIKSHNPNFKTTREIQKAKGSFFISNIRGTTIQLDNVLSGSSLQCRLMSFNMPASATVGSYIKEAYQNELDAAHKLDPKGSVIDITINSLYSDTSSMSKGYWHVDIDYLINNRPYNVKTTTEFESAFMANAACSNTANSFEDALAENFMKLFTPK